MSRRKYRFNGRDSESGDEAKVHEWNYKVSRPADTWEIDFKCAKNSIFANLAILAEIIALLFFTNGLKWSDGTVDIIHFTN